MSIGSEESSSASIQARPGPATAGSDPSATSPVTYPRTPTPPPSKVQPGTLPQPQQQQTSQHKQQDSSKAQPASLQTQQNAVPAAKSIVVPPKVAAPAPVPASQPPPRPPPPASAVSLHDAAAKNAANGGSSAAAAPIDPKQPSTPAPGPSSTSAQQAASQTSTGAKADANGSVKKTTKTKTPKTPGTTKPKQKRRANQANAQDELVYRPAPSTAGGNIGAAPDSSLPAMLAAAGGGRKAVPELVLPFQLPFVDVRPEMPMLDNASVHAAMAMGASETSSPDTGSDSDDYSVLSDASDLDSEAEESRREARRRRREPATIEESLVLLQSLRQSRLSHLSSLLTPFSQRVRSGMIYPNVLPLSLLHGLNPRDPHVLIQLGRADIHVGPHVFMKTKFWEVRPDYEMPPTMDPVARMRAPGTFGTPAGYTHMPGSQPLAQPLPQQLPQPQPPQLPSPRPPLAMPQPSVPLARPPTTTVKTPVVRPAPAAGQASNSSAATAPGANSQVAAIKSPAAPVTVSLPTPTLPATPVASSAAKLPAVPTRTPAPTILATSTSTTPATAPASAASVPAPAAKPVAASAATPAPATATVSTTPAVAAKPTASTPTVAPAAAAGVETKPVAALPAPVTLAPKPITVPVSLPRPPMTTPSLPRPPSINQNNIPSSASSSIATTSTAAPQQAAMQPASAVPKPSTTAATISAAPSAAGTVPAATAATPAPGQASAAAKPPANATATASGATAARPAGPPPPPAIDAVLVSRVNATAALNPELQELLHIAASGKATPNQLKALGVWIQAITAQLRQDEARNAAAAAANNAAGASGSRPGNAATTTADGKKSKKNKVDEAAKASKKQAKIEEREAKKKAKAEAKAKAQAEKQMAQKQQKDKQQTSTAQQQAQLHQQQQQQPQPSNKLRHPPPGWPTDGPPKPPVIVVEFRENPSMRFILPLWKCLVERTEGLERPSIPKIKKERRSFFDNDSDDEESQRIEPELKLSFFAPSLGSDAADGSGLRELEEELKRKAAEEAKLNAANAPASTAQGSAPANGASASPEAASSVGDKGDDTATASGKKKKAGAVTSSKKSSKGVKQEAADTSLSSDYHQSKKHEVYPLTWSIKGGVTESLWEAFGRVPGTMTCQPVKPEPEIELEPDVAEFLVPEIRYHLLDLPMEEIKIQKETTDTFVDLYSQVPDRRFILPRVAPVMLPQGLEDHLQDRFAVRPQSIQGRPIVKRKAGAREDDICFSYEGIGLAVIGPNGVKTEPGAVPAKPPKRKRHVATHNPDGSIKSCGACGKTKTPMWRRGPKGPSQLCNACGARWKAGRLVVPEVAPPPIIEAEEDKSKEEEARKEDEAQASMHGSNALVIPQSSSADDGTYTVMTSSGMVSPAAFGDHAGGGGGGMFSLSSDGKNGMDFGSPHSHSHLNRGSMSPSPFIRSPIPEDEVMPASVDPSMLSGTIRIAGHRR